MELLRKIAYISFGVQFPTSEPLKPKPEIAVKLPVIPQKTEQQKRQELFDTMLINQAIRSVKGHILVYNVPALIDAKVNRIIDSKQRYANIAHKFACPIKWYHIALIHELEAGGDFSRYLGNGQPFNKVTTIVPKGRGAFSSFEAGAIDAIRYEKLDKVNDWSAGNFLYIAEGYNGYGYSKFKGINSPYIWSGTNQYTSGYYIADSVYSSTTVSRQIGIAPMLKRLIDLGEAN